MPFQTFYSLAMFTINSHWWDDIKKYSTPIYQPFWRLG